jgi:hypothetical protein
MVAMVDKPKETSTHIIDQIDSIKPFIKIIGLFNRKIRDGFANLKAQLESVKMIQAEFDIFVDTYSPLGWCLHDNISTDLVSQVVKLSDDNGELILTNYYLSPNILEFLGYRICSTSYEAWQNLYETATERISKSDYVSAVPLLLIIVDGICTHFTGKNAFSGGAEAPVFDSIASKAGGLADGLRILGATKRRVSNDPTEAPFRNGILHGLNTNYGNAITAAKAVNLLRATIDYFDHKRDELARIERASREQTPPSWIELAQRINTTAKMTKMMEAWEKRPDQFGTIATSDQATTLEIGSPEESAYNYLKWAEKKNFGRLAEMTIDYMQRPLNMRAGRLSKGLKNVQISHWTITDVKDVLSAISEVYVSVSGSTNGKKWNIKGLIRLVFSDDDNTSLPRGWEGGKWLAIPKFLGDIEYAHITTPDDSTSSAQTD